MRNGEDITFENTAPGNSALHFICAGPSDLLFLSFLPQVVLAIDAIVSTKRIITINWLARHYFKKGNWLL